MQRLANRPVHIGILTPIKKHMKLGVQANDVYTFTALIMGAIYFMYQAPLVRILSDLNLQSSSFQPTDVLV
ncbi:hypothetical protein D3C79_1018530 [compost metagenome]